MKNISNFALTIVMVVIMVLAFSCTQYVPLTTALLEKHGVTDQYIGKIQVYNSNELNLYRYVENGTEGFYKGLLLESERVLDDQILFKKLTPGIIQKKLPDGKFLVRFEKQLASKTQNLLSFGSAGKYGNNAIMAKWNGGYGKLLYDGKYYEITDEDANTHLLVKKKSVRKVKRIARTVRGNKVKN